LISRSPKLSSPQPPTPRGNQIFVETLDTSTLSVSLCPDASVDHLASVLQQRLSICPEDQVLSCCGRPLTAGQLLKDRGVHHLSRIRLTVRLRGGVKGLKRKAGESHISVRLLLCDLLA
jgi:hypothetical protein